MLQPEVQVALRSLNEKRAAALSAANAGIGLVDIAERYENVNANEDIDVVCVVVEPDSITANDPVA